MPELEPRYYTYIGFGCAAVGLLFILAAIFTILGVLPLGDLAWAFFTALAMLAMLVATLAFNKIGRRRIPV